MDNMKKVSKKQFDRYPKYLAYLKILQAEGVDRVSSPVMSVVFNCSQDQIRKDFQAISPESGKPKIGRRVDEMINSIEEFLGYNNNKDAVIIGVGRLGTAFLNYDGFEKRGLNIVAGFDINDEIANKEINGRKIYHIDEIGKVIPELRIRIAVLTTPADQAQEMADKLVEAGIKGIWNFTGVHLLTPEDVYVESVELAASLALLSHKLQGMVFTRKKD